MPRFNFKLQKVLEARLSFEELAKREFGEAQRELVRQKHTLNILITTSETFIIEMTERRKKGAPVMIFKADIERDWSNKRNIREQRVRVKKAEDFLEKKRLKLVQAMKERKVMERLREKHLQDFKHNLLKEEIKFSDDIAGIRARSPENRALAFDLT